MRELPRGTVTFLFTDVEGSTRLLQEHGDAYAGLLGEHRRVLRDAFARHSGVEVDTQGDAFFVAFARASDALVAAEEAQRALADGPVRVRMGLHTGEPTVTEEGYVGMDVHRAARIAAAGHGGQVLVSQSTRDLVAAETLRDLGEHRLKDVDTPVRLYQLGAGNFPPLRTLNNTNLPLPPTPLVGRKKELADVLRPFKSGARLVTVTGPGGVGKTRFSLEVAHELVEAFDDGVWFVDLSPLLDAQLVVPTISTTLGAHVELADHLASKELLLVIDNFEQVTEAAPDIAELVRRCADVRILVTSREPLRIGGERTYPLRPLAEAPAVELLRSRAEAHEPEFEASFQTLAAIADRLDRLPLALELGAARLRTLGPDDLLKRLEQRLPLLTSRARDLPERQRTLRATIDWSYELLAGDEQQLFRRLAVFAGSFDIDAAEDVCDADLDALESLVDKSLLRRTREGRLFMLDTIREYAAERLEGDPAAQNVRLRHATRTLRVAEEAWGRHHDGFATLEREHDNARAAFEFLIATGETEGALRLALAYRDFWYVRGHIREGRRRLEVALDAAGTAPAHLRLPALTRAASLARVVGDADAAERHAAAAVALARERGDDGALAAALRELGEAMVARGDYPRALSLYEQSLALARAAGESPVPTLTNLADVALAAGEFERAIHYSAEAARLAGGPDVETVQAIAAFNTTSALIQLGRGTEATPHARTALETVVRIGYPELLGWCLAAVSGLAAASAPRDAAVLLGASESAVESSGAAFGPAEQRLRKWTLALLETRIDGGELERALDNGRGLAADDAVSLARQFLQGSAGAGEGARAP